LNTRITLPPHLPLSFEANAGQRNSSVQFSWRGKGHDLFLTSTEMVVSLTQPTAPAPSHGSRAAASGQWVVRMALVGANPSARLTGLGQQPQVANYFIGNDPAHWHRNVPIYSEVSYHNVYTGIDLLYYGNAQQQLEYDFTVNPGASPATIQLAFSGAQGLSINEFGDLVAHTPFGDVVEHAPLAYQMVQGAPQAVTCRYVAPDPAHIGFQLGQYDPTMPLVIDPTLTWAYSTYLGGGGDDEGTAVAVDYADTIDTNRTTSTYVTGFTSSSDFPTLSGFQSTSAGGNDAFVTKFSPTGSLVYSTYLGGSGNDEAYAIAVDGNGNAYVAGTTNSNSSNITSYAYDLLNRQTQTTDPKGKLTTTLYDAANNVVQVTDLNVTITNVSVYQYDALNRRTIYRDPLNHSIQYGYDRANNLTSIWDRAFRRRLLSYDELNRVVTQTWLDDHNQVVDNLTYSYDAANNVLTAANRAGTYTLKYDRLNRLSNTTDLFGLGLTDTYDAANNRTALQDSLGGLTTSTYDPLNRLTTRKVTATGQAPMRVDLAYNPRDQVVSMSDSTDVAGQNVVLNGLLQYDSLGRTYQVFYDRADLTAIEKVNYDYDDDNRLTAVARLAYCTASETCQGTNPAYSYNFTIPYDPDSQVTADLRSDLSTTAYAYDADGNRTNGGQVVGAANQISQDASWTYVYDNEGNLILKTARNGSGSWSYGYDPANRLTSAMWQDGSGNTQTIATYIYDVFGNRVEKDVTTIGGNLTKARFAYDGPNVWADFTVDVNGNSQFQRRYLRGDAVDQLFGREGTGADAAPLWYLADRQGSVLDIVNNQGTAMERVLYGNFGPLRWFNNMPGNQLDRYQYTGREYDQETSLQYNRARYFDSQTGRWLSQDPLNLGAGDTNLYRYVGNDPANATDPDGRFLHILAGAVAGGLLGATAYFVENGFSDVDYGKLAIYAGAGAASGAVASATFGASLAVTAGAGFSATTSAVVASTAAGAVGGVVNGFVSQGGVTAYQGGSLAQGLQAGGAAALYQGGLGALGGAVGGAVLSKLGGSFTGFVASGAAGGATAGGASGAISGYQDAGVQGAINGFVSGAVTGALVGAAGGGGAFGIGRATAALSQFQFGPDWLRWGGIQPLPEQPAGIPDPRSSPFGRFLVRTEPVRRDYGNVSPQAGFRRHHIKPLSLGGPDVAENVTLIPEPVHRQSHPGAAVRDSEYGTIFY
jgi:RHS repeat-associated protein